MANSYDDGSTRISRQGGLPKPISPAEHAVLDYGVAATFLGLAMRYRSRDRAASTLALINGGMVLGMSMLTDYPGGVWKRLSFKTHRTLDLVQAGLTLIGPTLMNVKPEAARTFHMQGASELGVVGLTDWDAGGNGSR